MLSKNIKCRPKKSLWGSGLGTFHIYTEFEPKPNSSRNRTETVTATELHCFVLAELSHINRIRGRKLRK